VLTGALDDMLERLDAAFAAKSASEARLRQFVDDASHELRTPVTSIRGYTELCRGGAVKDARAVEPSRPMQSRLFQ
jgi:two-component system, OmpR family, sensor kinase